MYYDTKHLVKNLPSELHSLQLKKFEEVLSQHK